MFELYKSYKLCQHLFKKHSKSYYLGAMLFPFHIFKHICAFYGFVRTIDSIVDNTTLSLNTKIVVLNTLESKFFNMYDTGVIEKSYDIEVYPALMNTITELNIPRDIFERFFKSMKLDLEQYQYTTYEELETYMDGSAGIVGETMLIIMSHNNPYYNGKLNELKPYAQKLGYSFQLTNFIRDIKEDYAMTPSRIYIPQHELKEHSIDLSLYTISACVDDTFRKCIDFQINRNTKLYAYSQIGIDKLHPNHQQAIHISKILYSGILDYIKYYNYELFGPKIKIGFYTKLSIIKQHLSFYQYIQVFIHYFMYSYFMFFYFL